MPPHRPPQPGEPLFYALCYGGNGVSFSAQAGRAARGSGGPGASPRACRSSKASYRAIPSPRSGGSATDAVIAGITGRERRPETIETDRSAGLPCLRGASLSCREPAGTSFASETGDEVARACRRRVDRSRPAARRAHRPRRRSDASRRFASEWIAIAGAAVENWPTGEVSLWFCRRDVVSRISHSMSLEITHSLHLHDAGATTESSRRPLLRAQDVTIQYRTAEHFITATYRINFNVRQSDRYVFWVLRDAENRPCSRPSRISPSLEGRLYLQEREIMRPGPTA